MPEITLTPEKAAAALAALYKLCKRNKKPASDRRDGQESSIARPVTGHVVGSAESANRQPPFAMEPN